tara:strand:- start:555 stop:1184 length:630 start_codon:yes stop_codon:yes gene_type:complete
MIETTSTDFDPNKNYMSLLSADDKYKESNREYPYLRGLKKLAHVYRGGLKSVVSKVIKVPSLAIAGNTKEIPDCIAAVTVGLTFNDGTYFEGSADASYKAHKAPFNKHLVATAESKAEARAIRRAFNINEVAKEEMGTQNQDEDVQPDINGPISDVQIEGIKKIAKRKKLGQKDVLALISKEEIEDISSLTRAQGIAALRAVNRYKLRE